MGIKYSEILATDEVLSAGNDDIILLAIVDGGSPTGYTTKAIKKSNLITAGGNIYDIDGTLTANRVMTMDGFSLKFEGGASLKDIFVNSDAEIEFNYNDSLVGKLFPESNGIGFNGHFGINGGSTISATFRVQSQVGDIYIAQFIDNAGLNTTRFFDNGNIIHDGDIDINGAVKIVDGTQQAGYVLTSDASGNASWQAAGGGGGNTLYTADDTVGAGRVATLTDSLTFTGGDFVIRGASGTTNLFFADESAESVAVNGFTDLNGLSSSQAINISRGGVTLFQIGSATTEQVNIPKTVLIGAASTADLGATLDVFNQSGKDIVNFRTTGGAIVAQQIDSAGRTGFHDGTTAIQSNSIVTISAGVSSTKAPLCIFPTTSARAITITAADGMIIYVNDTNGTFTSVGFWGRENGAWVKL